MAGDLSPELMDSPFQRILTDRPVVLGQKVLYYR